MHILPGILTSICIGVRFELTLPEGSSVTATLREQLGSTHNPTWELAEVTHKNASVSGLCQQGLWSLTQNCLEHSTLGKQTERVITYWHTRTRKHWDLLQEAGECGVPWQVGC